MGSVRGHRSLALSGLKRPKHDTGQDSKNINAQPPTTDAALEACFADDTVVPRRIIRFDIDSTEGIVFIAHLMLTNDCACGVTLTVPVDADPTDRATSHRGTANPTPEA